MSDPNGYSVRAAYCHHRSSDDEIYDTICRIIAPLSRSLEKLKEARKIVIKTNMAWPKDRIQYFEGRRRELVDDSVMRAVLKFLRKNTTAQITATDTCFHRQDDINYMPLLNEYGVEFIDSNKPPFRFYDVPGGGLMFSRYKLSACLAEADAVVSVAKIKTHAFMGVTLCLKNLFGLPPMFAGSRPRNYFHHLIRLSYVLPDLGLIVQPCLNIIDGLVGQTRREWNGDGRVCNALIAGDHVIATDACGTWLMGHDPLSDWPTPPFKRDRNALLVAAENGFGTVDLNEIDFQTDVEPPLAEFDPDEPDSKERVKSWRKTTCEQALFYRDHREEIMDKHAGEYVFLQDGEVVWNGFNLRDLGSRRGLARERPDSALWLKLVDPNDIEKEHFEVYEGNLGRLI
ncbi:DUF362 domain-containing protein [Candidatus Poribacteria bacterium]